MSRSCEEYKFRAVNLYGLQNTPVEIRTLVEKFCSFLVFVELILASCGIFFLFVCLVLVEKSTVCFEGEGVIQPKRGAFLTYSFVFLSRYRRGTGWSTSVFFSFLAFLQI